MVVQQSECALGPQNCAVKAAKRVKSMSCVFYHNLKKLHLKCPVLLLSKQWAGEGSMRLGAKSRVSPCLDERCQGQNTPCRRPAGGQGGQTLGSLWRQELAGGGALAGRRGSGWEAGLGEGERGHLLGAGLRHGRCEAGMPGTVNLGVKVRAELRPCRGSEASKKGRQSQASGRRVPLGHSSLGRS